jgi:hypothetical protein
MSWVDIFYLTLVITAITGFALALAYFSHGAVQPQAGRGRDDGPPKQAPTQVKPKAPVERVPEHA